MITLYDAARCPYCARVRIVLAEKGVPYEPVEIDLADRPGLAVREEPGREGARARGGRLGAARVGRDRRVPQRALPRAAALAGRPGRARAGRLLVFRFDDFSKPYYAFRRGEEGARERFEEELGFLDALLQGTPWLSGRAFGLADVAFLPWVLRARDLLGVSLEPWPALAGVARARVRAAVGRGRAGARRGAVTVVHLHALPLDERMWPRPCTSTAPRLYGLGRTMDDWADAVLEAYPGRLILVGASMGGYCALAAARRAPERVAGLVLVGLAAGGGLAAAPREARGDDRARAEARRRGDLGGDAREALPERRGPRRSSSGAREIALEPHRGRARRARSRRSATGPTRPPPTAASAIAR